jgi:PAS domain S-box-containing protein
MPFEKLLPLLSTDAVLQVLTLSMHEEIYIFDAEGLKFLFVNQGACENLHYTMEELYNLTPYDIKPEYTKESFMALVQPLLKGEKRQLTFETVHKRKDGTTYPVKINLQLIQADGQSVFLAIIEDITERKKAEALLSLQHAQLLAITETAKDAIIMMDSTGAISYWNRAAEHIFGYARNEALGQNLHRLLMPSRYWEEHERAFERFQGTGQGNAIGKTLELSALRKDGVEITIELSLAALKQGDKWSAVGVVRDITERKKAEAALQRQYELNRKLLDAIPHPMWLITRERRIIAQNQAAERMGTQTGGFCWEKIHNMNTISEEQRSHYLKTGVPAPGTKCYFCRADEALNAQQTINTEIEYNDVFYDVWWIPIDENTYLHYAIDLTEQKDKERRLRQSEASYRHLVEEFQALLNAIPDMITFQTPDMKVLWANENTLKALNLGMAELTGRHCYEIWHGRSTPCEKCPLLTQQAAEGPVISTITLPTGQILELRSVPFYSNGVLMGTIDIRRDVTGHKRMERQLFHAQKMETIGTLAGGIAHDFNNILTAIVGFGQLALMRLNPDDMTRRYIQNILDAADRAATLTKGLLTFSRQQSGDKRPVKLNQAVQNMEKLLRKTIREDITLQLICSSKELLVSAEPVQLDQVLMNLVVNARDAMPQGGTLTIATDDVEMTQGFIERHGYGKEGHYARITVRDTGIGMDKATLEHIFEPFFTTKEVGKGTGLGLSIVYGIVKDHDGYISCESEPGKGTTFEIYLPILKEDKAAEGLEQGHVAESRPSPSAVSGTGTILFAEDNDTVRDSIAQILRSAGYSVIEAVNGADALQRFRENASQIDLLLTDILMPEMNGTELYEAIKAIQPSIKTIFMTGYAPDELATRLPVNSQTQILYKPIQPLELLQQVKAILVDSE